MLALALILGTQTAADLIHQVNQKLAEHQGQHIVLETTFRGHTTKTTYDLLGQEYTKSDDDEETLCRTPKSLWVAYKSNNQCETYDVAQSSVYPLNWITLEKANPNIEFKQIQDSAQEATIRISVPKQPRYLELTVNKQTLLPVKEADYSGQAAEGTLADIVTTFTKFEPNDALTPQDFPLNPPTWAKPSQATEASHNGTFHVGDQIPEETLALPTKQKISLHEFFSHHPYNLLTFWFIGCHPCRLELPELIAAQKTYGDQLGILSADVSDPEDSVVRFYKSQNVPFQTALIASQPDLLITLKVPACPTTYITDRTGKILAVFDGYEKGGIDAKLKALGLTTGGTG